MFHKALAKGFCLIAFFGNSLAPCGASTEPAGGGEFLFSGNDSPSFHQHKAIQAQLAKQQSSQRINTRALAAPAENSAGPVEFIWPLRAVPWSKDFSYYGYSNFVDHDNANPNSLLDYQCGDRTYDVVGYNHRGTDIFLWPFPWNKMAADEVEVVAAAPGTIIAKIGGNDDDSCDYTGKEWNAVYVQHADSSIAWYVHFKKNSLTSKTVGDSVAAGDFLGIVGSSGNSSIPHLHLEIYDAQGNLNDPFAGACNSMNVNSWWIEQPDYEEASVNRLTVGPKAADLGVCPAPATPNENDTVVANQRTYFTAYFHGQRDSDVVNYSIHSPPGSEIRSWTHSSSEPLYNASYWYWYYSNLAAQGGYGVWEFSVDYLSKQYTKRFNVVPDCDNDIDQSGNPLLNLDAFCNQLIPTLALPSGQWKQIALPADPGAINTVYDIFADDLAPQSYGTDWVLFSYDASLQAYQRLEIMDKLEAGTGYWIIQATGEPVTLTLVEHIPQSLSGLDIPLFSAEDIVWNMTGYSGAETRRWWNVATILNSGSCPEPTGCTLAVAAENDIIYPVAFHFDGENYQQLNAESSIAPWAGVWLATLPSQVESTLRIQTD